MTGTSRAERPCGRTTSATSFGGRALDRLTPGRPTAYCLAYAKGAWAHRMLEGWLGGDAYLGALARLARDNPRPSVESYRAALAEALPSRNALCFDRSADL